MQLNRRTGWLAVIAVFASWFVLPDRAPRADDKPAGRDKIRELQKQRLEAATAARDYLVRQWKADDLLDSVNTPGFTGQLLESNKLVHHARLNLCDTKAERIKAIEDSIKEFEPIVALFEKHFKARIVDSTVPYRLAQAHLLDLQIALEKAKQ
jgi:hypothetical protein